MRNYAANAILTKSRAKYGKRVTLHDYRTMVSQNNTTDIITYLKDNTHYGEFAQNESELREKLKRDFLDLFKLERAVGETFYKYILLENEINRNLKRIRANESIQETEYYPLIAPYLADLDYSMIESMLKKYLYDYLFSIIKDFPKAEQKELKDLFELKIETENIARIYRGKKYYNETASLLRAELMPYRRYLKSTQFNALIDANNAPEVIELLKGTIYGKFFNDINFYTIDDLLQKIYIKHIQRKMHTSSYPSVVMFCCMTLFEVEVKNIVNILEGVRYKLSAGEINKLLCI